MLIHHHTFMHTMRLHTISSTGSPRGSLWSLPLLTLGNKKHAKSNLGAHQWYTSLDEAVIDSSVAITPEGKVSGDATHATFPGAFSRWKTCNRQHDPLVCSRNLLGQPRKVVVPRDFQ